MTISELQEGILSNVIKKIIGYNDYYVSIDGRIISANYRRSGMIKELSLGKNQKGYLMADLSAGKVKTTVRVHRLVAEYFVQNPLMLNEVNHIDENKENNAATNLEWVTRKYNINYGTGIARSVAKRSLKIEQVTHDGVIVKTWDSINEAGRNGYSRSLISMCLKGKRESHKGYLWREAA